MVKQQDKRDGHEHWRTEADAIKLAEMLLRSSGAPKFHVKRVGT